MPTWTKEQEKAIYESGKNIIVSAGAGSGKTAVLSERVIEKLKNKVHINELLILTFTKAAAAEMKERIRKKIKKDKELKEEENLIDSAYITTFDSFAMSVVKKYHYLLNVSKDLTIIDSAVIDIKKRNILDEIFDYYYQNLDEKFLNLINTFCIKDDITLKEDILSLNNKLDLKIDKISYLETYIEKNYKEEKIEKDIISYENILKDKIENIKINIDNLSLLTESEYIKKVYESLTNLLNSNNYDEIKENLNVKLPTLPRNSDEEVKLAKEKLNKSIKSLEELCPYSNKEEIIDSINKTKPITKIVIKIIIDLHNKVLEFKNNLDAYEFNDIAIMAIKVLDNKEAREELKNSFKEILIDEYQDTNDLQETFISKIENNNVYMVGDIKQSIYRFRNANPYIFKGKYDEYSKLNGGIKIDLLKNFRSREEVLNNINKIFNLIMDDEIGGANYIKDHQMVFGNTSYIQEGKTNQNNNIEIYTYNPKETEFSKEEIEIFIIAKDIKEKVESGYQVFDKDNLTLRNITYNDFVILIDRSTTFDLYKKIFEYLAIPLSILKDEKLNTDDDIIILKNIINFIIKVAKKEYDTEFKYLFTSITRSFVYAYKDDEIFTYFVNNNFMDSPLYKTSLEIVQLMDKISIRELIDTIMDKFNYIEKLMTIGNIEKSIIKLDKIKDTADNLSLLGYDIYKFNDYFKQIIENDYKITFNVNENGNNSVKIMTIHKSKGLEYHICYFPGLYKEFNLMELKQQFIYDNTYGIITPYFDEGIGKTIYKELLKEKYKKEEISEKIRLFYVAVTRAKEKMIAILPNNLNNTEVVKLDKNKKMSYKCFKDIFDSIYNQTKEYYKVIDINKLGLTNDYNKIKKSNYKENINKLSEVIKVSEINIDNNLEQDIKFSKSTNKIISKKEKENMDFGTKIHEILEIMEIKDKNIDKFCKENPFILKKISSFLNSKLLENINDAKIYKEYEFVYNDKNNSYHGIIDLMLEYNDHIIIIDYKLKNTDEEAYLKQLNGYKKYIEKITNKKVKIYLYSILKETYEEIK